MMPSLSDKELLTQVRERDSDAFETLFARYKGLVRWHVVNIIHDEDAADELVLDVFLRVWTHGEQWDGRGPFKAWLLRIATNLGINLLRSLRRRRETPIDLPDEFSRDDDDSQAPAWMIDDVTSRPDVALEISERRSLLWRLVDELPEEKRDVIRLVHEAEMDIREAAETLGVPEGTVKSRLHHARQRLAREWKEIETEWEE
jgi:RNA polymerase sigma-70 factor, ECF subfamily